MPSAKVQLITVRHGKGDKDRITPLPKTLVQPLKLQIQKVDALHQQELAEGFGEVIMPDSLSIKYPTASKNIGWQFLFPASKRSIDPRSGKTLRHHLHDTYIQREVNKGHL